MLSIPNYYRRKVNQNSKKSNHTSQNGHSKKSTDNKCSRQLERDVTPASPTQHSGHWQQPLKGESLHVRKKTFKGANPRIWHTHTWSYISGKPSFKKTHAPHVHFSTTYRSQETAKQMSTDRLKSTEKVVHVYNGLLLSLEKATTEIMKLCQKSLRGRTLGDHTLSEISETEEDKRIWYPYRQNFKTWRKII